MKFAEGGVIQAPYYPQPADSLIPEESIKVENLRTALKLDLMLLELEASFGQESPIIIDGKALNIEGGMYNA